MTGLAQEALAPFGALFEPIRALHSGAAAHALLVRDKASGDVQVLKIIAAEGAHEAKVGCGR